MKYKNILLILLIIMNYSCQSKNKGEVAKIKKSNAIDSMAFKSDLDFLKKYTEIVLLKLENARVAVAPALQGRVMTSSADGMEGTSYGWINKAHFKSGDTLKQINVYGGEERFWLGPEGGQYSIYFQKGDDFIFENWATPRVIDLEPYEITDQTDEQVSFTKSAKLTNYSGFTFDFQVDRNISLLSDTEIESTLSIKIPQKVKSMGYRTNNQLKNVGLQEWKKDSGLLSIWLLGMLRHSPTTTVIIPYIQGEEAELGVVVNDDYFGKVPENRLVITDKAIFFKADGQERGKIGLSPQRGRDVLGSYDPMSKSLTIVKYNKPEDVTDYVNSKWELQDEPYKGDVINSYNDGAPEPGAKPLGPFYELETSSPAAALAPDKSIEHIQYTFHFEGDEADLNNIAQSVLGVSLIGIQNVFE